MVIWCYSANGTPCTGFGTNDIVVSDGAGGETGASDHGNSLAIDSPGRILVTGVSRNALGNWVMVIWCYESDGDPCGTLLALLSAPTVL